MTTTLSVKGQVVIPRRIRTGHRLKPGADFMVIASANGDIILRPVKLRKRHATFGDNLLALSGLPINPEPAPARDLDP